MEDLAKVFGTHPSTRFMEWHVIGRNGVSERRIGPKREKAALEIGTDPDGTFCVGDSIRLDVKPPFPGYFQLWNLGTSGESKPLVKSFRVDGGFSIPGESGRVGVQGPPTSEKGLFEIVIGIITKEPVEIDPAAMGAARSAVSTRGGIGAVEEVKKTSLSDLPESDWEWCILETEVV